MLYDIANFTKSNYNHTRANAPEVEFELTGSVGAAIRVDDYKLVVGCETLAGCARWQTSAQCALCSVYFCAQPNKLRPILKFEFWYPIEHIFVPACSSVRKLHFFTFLCFPNSRTVISPEIWPCIHPVFSLYCIQDHFQLWKVTTDDVWYRGRVQGEG